MKKFITVIFAIIIAFPIFAGTKLISGDLSNLPWAKAIPVFVNWDNAVYGKSGGLADFLSTSIRDDNWKRFPLTICLLAPMLRRLNTVYGWQVLRILQATNIKWIL